MEANTLRWKDIDGWNAYSVSSNGDILRKSSNRLRRLNPDKDGYLLVILSQNNTKRTLKVHRLVAQAFIPNPNNLPQVNHKNGIKSDNRVENLEWCDGKYNVNYSHKFMKKIMFSDKNGLTQAVLDGRKTQTRRIVPSNFFTSQWDVSNDTLVVEDDDAGFVDIRDTKYCRYKKGEIVAVAQSYRSIADELENCNNATCAAHYEKNVQKASEYISWMEHPGFNNKLFVAADRMIHKIRITDVRVEKLQDISDEDCLKEGIYEDGGDDAFIPHYFYNYENSGYGGFDLPQMAYADLINRISGKRTWESNPYVFVYDFELVK